MRPVNSTVPLDPLTVFVAPPTPRPPPVSVTSIVLALAAETSTSTERFPGVSVIEGRAGN